MKVYVNSKNEIKDVGSTTDTSLTELEITDGTFDDWTTAKICCYKVNVSDGNVTMMTPYVDTRLIEHITKLGKADDSNGSSVSELELALEEVYELLNSSEE